MELTVANAEKYYPSMSHLTELFKESMGCFKGNELSARGGDQVGTVTPWQRYGAGSWHSLRVENGLEDLLVSLQPQDWMSL